MSFKNSSTFAPIQFETQAGNDPELLGDFISVARQNLSDVALRLQWLQRNPVNAAALQAIWRNFYTIKSLAGFLNLSVVAAVAQELETLFDQARLNKLTLSPAQIQTVLNATSHLDRRIHKLNMVDSPDWLENPELA